MNDLMDAASLRLPMPRGIPLQTPGAEKHVASISPSVSELERMTPPQDLALVPKRQSQSPQVPEDLVLSALEGAYLPGASALVDLSTLESLEMTIPIPQ